LRRQTKLTNISKDVKEAVYERDDGCCVLCGRPGLPNAHYIPRSQGGLGIERNIVTLCLECHSKYDQSAERKFIRQILKAYLQSKYDDWDESKLVYNKYYNI